MTNDLLHRVHKAVTVIEKYTRIRWYDWCDLFQETIRGDLLAEFVHDERHTKDREVHCPPAVEAAIIAYTMLILDEFDVYHWPCAIRAYVDSYCMFISPTNRTTLESVYSTRLDASVALLEAVAEEIDRNESVSSN